LFFFFGALDGDDFFVFFAEEIFGTGAGAARLLPDFAGFDIFLGGFALLLGCCEPYMGM
jgi:hypothetical protein